MSTMTMPQIDSKIDAFLSASGPEIFRPIAFPTEVWYPDPLDVEAIHADARDLFDTMLSKAVRSDIPSKTGRIIVLRGEAGSGKTHLMRAFRTHAHRRGAGYFGYMQMTTARGNYARYILRKLIDSLDVPYYSPALNPNSTTGLDRLSTAVAESEALPRDQVRRLREEDLHADECAALVLSLADEAVRDPALSDIPIDVIMAMLFLQSEHPAVKNRVMKYLRAESLSEHDRTRLAGITPLDEEDSAQLMIQRLGKLMWSLQGAALILCVDQLEDSATVEGGKEHFRRVIQELIRTADILSSSLVVVSCLDDYYDTLRGYLNESHRDRLELDPPPIKLQSGRTRSEISEIVATQLGHLFDYFEISNGNSDPTFPIPEPLLRDLVQSNTRSLLNACKSYRERCIRQQQLVPYESTASSSTVVVDKVCEVRQEERLLTLDQQWNDFLANYEPSLPDEDDELSHLLAAAISLCTDELQTGHCFHADPRDSHVIVSIQSEAAGETGTLVVGVCNKGAQGGGLTKQVEAVLNCDPVKLGRSTPIIVRSTEFVPKSPKAAITKHFAQLYATGGRYVIVPESCWRTLVAMRSFRAMHATDPHFTDWLRHAEPLTRLHPIRDILGLDELSPQSIPTLDLEQPSEPDSVDAPSPSHAMPSEPPTNGSASYDDEVDVCDSVDPVTVAAPGIVTVGRARNRSQAEITLTHGDLTVHTAYLGSSGSGKTTAALNIIEQLLCQGVPALLVDRKGDLVTYACDEVWQRPVSDPEQAERQRRLRERLDVKVYTPGNDRGRTIRLPVAPDGLAEMHAADRAVCLLQAAESLGQMLNCKSTGKGGKYICIMLKAMELMSELGYKTITLNDLIDYIDERDDALVSAVGKLGVKLFDSLVADLQVLLISRQSLFSAEGDPLSAEQLLGVGPNTSPGKTRLSVISTKFLGNRESIQFWVAQLLLELSRWASKSPSKTLQAVVLFDEADLYLPATSKPASKEPMEDLLKRARSAGLGMMLATQSPGDFDYKSKENISNWFIGKIKENTAINKMKPLLSSLHTDIGSQLSAQKTGEFILVSGTGTTSLTGQRSLVEIVQLPENRILDLASGNGGATSQPAQKERSRVRFRELYRR